MADLEGVENASVKVGKDLFAGAVGGIAQVLLGRLGFCLCSLYDAFLCIWGLVFREDDCICQWLAAALCLWGAERYSPWSRA